MAIYPVGFTLLTLMILGMFQVVRGDNKNPASKAQISLTPWFSGEPPVLKITGHTYDKTVIYHRLQKAYETCFNLDKNNHAKLYLGNSEDERKCIEKTQIKYYIKTLGFGTKEYEASECRINLNPQYQVIINPTLDVRLVYNEDDPVINQLKNNLIGRIGRLNNPDFSQLQFYDFDHLSYKTDCLIDYQDIGQIKFKELHLNFNIQQVMNIPSECGFQKIDKEFDGTFIQNLNVQIPINGTFHCKIGRSSTCKKSFAEHSNNRYKLLAEA